MAADLRVKLAGADVDLGAVLRRIRARVQSPRPLLARVALIVATQAAQRFQTQGSPPNSWRERAVPNIAGVLADLAEGSEPKSRRCDPRPALIDRGTLQNTVQAGHRVISDSEAEAGTRLPYAALHQFGGETTKAVTPAIKRRLWEWMKRTETFCGQPTRTLFGWLLNKRVSSVTFNVPARPFYRVTREDRREIDDEVRAYVAEEGAGGPA